MKQLLFLALLVFFLIFFESNSQLTINSTLRSRFQYYGGFEQLPVEGVEPAMFFDNRARLKFNYTHNDDLIIYMSLHDAFVWGDVSFKNVNNRAGVYEAWFKYFFDEKLSVKVGRQEVKIDDGRIFSDEDWNDLGLTHDLGILQFRDNENTLNFDLGLGWNNKAGSNSLISYDVMNYKYLAFLWLNKKFLDDKLNTSLMFMNYGGEKFPTSYKLYDTIIVGGSPIITSRDTSISHPDVLYGKYIIGSFICYDEDSYGAKGTFNYQFGKNYKGQDVKNAYFFSVEGYWKPFDLLQFTLGVEHFSGTDMSDTVKFKSRHNSYSNLFDEYHDFLGEMDYFGDVIQNTNYAGLNSIYGKLNIFFSEKANLQVTCLVFGMDKDYITPTLKVDKYLGTEIDFFFKYQIADDVIVKAAYDFMLPGATLEKLQGVPVGKSKFASFGYISVEFSPNIFTGK